MAILSYYGFATVDEPWFVKGMVFGPAPLVLEQGEEWVKEDANTGSTPAHFFDMESLLPDMTRDPAYRKPEVDEQHDSFRRLGFMLPWVVSIPFFLHFVTENEAHDSKSEIWRIEVNRIDIKPPDPRTRMALHV